MEYEYDLPKIKEELNIEQIKDIVAELGGEPQLQNNILLCKTICHGGDSHKLYYYENSHLFHCYTGCEEPSFDIFELVRKVKSRELDEEYDLPKAVRYVAQYFGYAPLDKEEQTEQLIDKDLTYIQNFGRINNIELETQIIELKAYDDKFLKNLPQPHLPWEKEGISREIIEYYNIRYNPKTGGILIPYYDENNRLIGIRERNLVEDQIERYGKYHPAIISGKMFNHPLSFGLYNLNNSKNNIQQIKKVIIFEGEKSCLKYASYFGKENDISVACTGSAIIKYQIDLLLKYNVNEIIIAFDHDFTDINSEEAKKVIRKIKSIHKKFNQIVTLSFLWDKENLLGYKDSPIDKGKDIFLYLFNNRLNLY